MDDRRNVVTHGRTEKTKVPQLDENCQKLGVLQCRFDEFNVRRIVREVTGNFKKESVGKLVNDAEGY